MMVNRLTDQPQGERHRRIVRLQTGEKMLVSHGLHVQDHLNPDWQSDLHRNCEIKNSEVNHRSYQTAPPGLEGK